MRYFSIKNWEEFQHYKDRSPPWIKLYNALLDDYDFCRLQDASKAHLVAIWMLASRSGDRLPYDSDWIASKISATETVDLDALADAGFILLEQPLHKAEQGASAPLAKRLPREETEQRQSSAKAEPEGSDIAQALYGPCLDYLTANGVKERNARSLLGKWRKNHCGGDVVAAIRRAQRQGVSEPVAWLEKALAGETYEPVQDPRDIAAQAEADWEAAQTDPDPPAFLVRQ